MRISVNRAGGSTGHDNEPTRRAVSSTSFFCGVRICGRLTAPPPVDRYPKASKSFKLGESLQSLTATGTSRVAFTDIAICEGNHGFTTELLSVSTSMFNEIRFYG